MNLRSKIIYIQRSSCAVAFTVLFTLFLEDTQPISTGPSLFESARAFAIGFDGGTGDKLTPTHNLAPSGLAAAIPAIRKLSTLLGASQP